MKDFLGKELSIGDYVVILQNGKNCGSLEEGIIDKFTPKLAVIDTGANKRWDRFTKKDSSHIVKISKE